MRKNKGDVMKQIKISGIIFLISLICSIFVYGEGDQVDPAKHAKKSNDPKSLNPVFSVKELELFNKVLYVIESQYYQQVDSKKLITDAIKGMIASLDPHSAFLDKDLYKKMENETNGEFGGIGIEVTQKDNALVIVTTIEDTPAYKAGLRAGDRIIEINHKTVLGLPLEVVIDRMKGKIGENIHLSVMRSGIEKAINFKVKREMIKIRAVKSWIFDKNFVVLRLTQFQRNAAEGIISALEKAQKETKDFGGLKGIVLDLRSNPGGLLDQAVEVASIFLDSGEVVSTEDKNGNVIDTKYVTKSGFKDTKTPLVVLVNGSSASASEIVAGALQDTARGIIMGSQTFGKGSVQSLIQIDQENAIKLTIAQYLTPKKRKIQALGIKPDIEFDEYDAKWVKENKKRPKFLREKDLGNHLRGENELIEDDDIADDSKDADHDQQKSTVQKNKDNKVDKENKDAKENKDDASVGYDPSEDFQVVQAMNYLKGLKIFKSYP